MAVSGVNSESVLGFLTVVEDRKHGLFGGYLILNRAGRPLEFHCTAPIRPNRAQEILYGRTLRPYLYGEQIGRTLLEQGKHNPFLLLTDCEPMMSVCEFAPTPVALVTGTVRETESEQDRPLGQDAGRTWRVDPAQKMEPNLRLLQIGRQRLALSSIYNGGDDDRIVEKIEAVAAGLDLAEPFERIRAAIDEARRGGQ